MFHFGGVTNAGVLGNAPDIELYFRNVTAVNSTATYDNKVLAGSILVSKQDVVPAEVGTFGVDFAQMTAGGGQGPRVFMGREIQQQGQKKGE